MDKIINIPQVDPEKLKSQWKLSKSNARAVVDMTKTPGWEIVSKKLRDGLEDTFDAVIRRDSDWLTIKDNILLAKAIQHILTTVEGYQVDLDIADANLKKME